MESRRLPEWVVTERCFCLARYLGEVAWILHTTGYVVAGVAFV